MIKPITNFSSKLREARRKLGWTYEEVGIYFGLSKSAIWQYENGERQFSSFLSFNTRQQIRAWLKDVRRLKRAEARGEFSPILEERKRQSRLLANNRSN